MINTRGKLKSLCDLFGDDIKYIVPDYQRGYSWGSEQLEALWEDLGNLADGRFHYTGMLTFCKTEQNDNSYYIVDGQQRMTTLIILINELLSKIQGGILSESTIEEYVKKYLYYTPYGQIKNEYHFQYSVDNPSNSFFITQILGQEDSASYNQPEQTLYTKNLKYAKNFFAEKLTKIGQTELAALFIKVTEKLRFNEYLIEDIDEVYVTFEIMNNRGKSLSSLELLKNRLIYLSTLYGNSSNNLENIKILRENINNTWKTIYEYLGKSESKVLNDDMFLRDHWIMYFRYDRSTSMVFRKDLLSNEFTVQRVLENKLSIQSINNYVLNLQKSIIQWFNITCPEKSKFPPENNEWQARLNRVGIGSFRPLLMAAYQKCNNESEVLPLIKACERFRFLVSSLAARRSNTGDSLFYNLAHNCFTGVDVDVVKVVNEKTERWYDAEKCVNECAIRYKDGGFYSWSGLRYFLYEYEKYLQTQSRDGEKVKWEDFEQSQNGKISIEHIFPQSPSEDDAYWSDRFKSPEDKELTHSLGNLLLLSQSKNSSLQNGSFDDKKEKYRTGSHSEIDVSRYEEWTPRSIVKRGVEMLTFMVDHWELPEFSLNQIQKLLNVSEVVYSESISIGSSEGKEIEENMECDE